jgi:precorrin-8X/cobalt-precorrin-8 methylmutase
VRDGADNRSNRFEVATELNRLLSGGPFPFWGCPPAHAGDLLTGTKPAGYGEDGLAELRLTERRANGVQPTWKLAYPGSVGSQTLLGIACLERLRRHPWLEGAVRVWPLETGLRPLRRPGPGEAQWRILLAEVYPSMIPIVATEGEPRDRAQVRLLAQHYARLDEEDALAAMCAGPDDLTDAARRRIEREEGWILGIEKTRRGGFVPPPAVPPPLPEAALSGPPAVTRYDYVREPQAIYRLSFATIRGEADLSALPAELEPLAVRLIHAAGDPAILADLAWSDGAFAAGRRALAGGTAILVDTEMVAAGIIRARLPAGNAVICTLGEPGVAEAARALATTRSAAAVDRWRERLAGAVVVIGNAPTALFRLLELLDAGAPLPAVVLGFPVGFVGAAESKAALIEHGGVAFIALRGRRGGSALAAAALNALAADGA